MAKSTTNDSILANEFRELIRAYNYTKKTLIRQEVRTCIGDIVFKPRLSTGISIQIKEIKK